MAIDIERLRAPFPPDRVSWRVGSTTQAKDRGMALAYIDSRDVQDRLDEVCGAENWQSRYPHANGKTVCEIGIRVGQEWVWKADGAGDTDVEAEKGALSDAFKRAAVRWGIGRYLYDLPSPWVALVARGRSYAIADGEYQKLLAMLTQGAKAVAAQPITPTTAAPAPPAPAPAPAAQPVQPDALAAAKRAFAQIDRDLSAAKSAEDVQTILEISAAGLRDVKAASIAKHDQLLAKAAARTVELTSGKAA